MSPRLKLSLALPVLGVALLIARAEIVLRSGAPLLVPITGYDPRDLLEGHYLNFRYDWDLDKGEPCFGGDCCLCVEPALASGGGDPKAGPRPRARSIRCDDAASCTHRLRTGEGGPPTRYYVPEDRAQALERVVRDRRAAVLLSVRRDGRAAIKELYLDGQPWDRSAAATSPPAPPARP